MKIVLDSETTGIDVADEILQLSIVYYHTGAFLMDEYFKPARKRRWYEAQHVHGISPEMVADKRRTKDALPEIQNILDQATQIIGYNASFDTVFLSAIGRPCSKSCQSSPQSTGSGTTTLNIISSKSSPLPLTILAMTGPNIPIMRWRTATRRW